MIEIDDLHLSYHTEEGSVLAVRGVGVAIEQGQFFTLLGPSGCGKTSTLRAIAGLETPSDGEISIDSKLVYHSARRNNVAPHCRDIGMVFQSYAIWPHMEAFENVAFPLREMSGRMSRTALREKVLNALSLVQLEGFEGRPHVGVPYHRPLALAAPTWGGFLLGRTCPRKHPDHACIYVCKQLLSMFPRRILYS